MSWATINEHLEDVVRENASGTPIAVEADKNDSGNGKGKGKGPEQAFPPTTQKNVAPTRQNSGQSVPPNNQSNIIDLTNNNTEDTDTYDYTRLLKGLQEPGKQRSLAHRILAQAVPMLLGQIKMYKDAYEANDPENARKVLWELGWELSDEDVEDLKTEGGNGNGGGNGHGGSEGR